MVRSVRSESRIISVFLCVLLIALIVPSAPPTAHALVTIYVDGATGDDATGDGSASSPFKTIGKGSAAALMGGGGSVYVRPGTYNLASGETFPIGIQVGAMIVGLSGGDGVIVDATGSGQAAFYCENGSTSTGLESLTVIGGDSPNAAGAYAS